MTSYTPSPNHIEEYVWTKGVSGSNQSTFLTFEAGSQLHPYSVLVALVPTLLVAAAALGAATQGWF